MGYVLEDGKENHYFRFFALYFVVLSTPASFQAALLTVLLDLADFLKYVLSYR